MKKSYLITLGLGRVRIYEATFLAADVDSEDAAILLAKRLYLDALEAELGRRHPIWDKALTVSKVAEIESVNGNGGAE